MILAGHSLTHSDFSARRVAHAFDGNFILDAYNRCKPLEMDNSAVVFPPEK